MRAIFVLFCFSLAHPVHATNSYPTFFIPSPFKLDFIGHSTGAAAAWNTQKLAGGTFTQTEQKTKASGASNKSKSKEFNAYTYQHYQPVTIEANYTYEKDTESDSSDYTKSNLYNLQFGSQMPNLPLALGLTYENEKAKTYNGFGGSTNKDRTLTFSASYKLNESLFLGGGYIQSKFESEPSYSDDDDSFFFGAGYVTEALKGESVLLLKNEEGEKMYTLLSQGAWAMGADQWIGSVELYFLDEKGSQAQATLYDLGVGYYFDLQGFYVQPEIGYLKSESKNDQGDKSSESTLSTEVIGGLKSAQYNLFATLGLAKSELKYPVFSSKLKRDTTLIGIGAHFYF